MDRGKREVSRTLAPASSGATGQTGASLDCGHQLISLLVNQWHSAMVRMALRYVSTQDAAEEVVQATWLAVWQGLATFRGHASFRTWVFAILIKRAQSWTRRERRFVSFSDWSMGEQGEEEIERSIHCRQAREGEEPGHWLCSSQDWQSPEELVLQQEMTGYIHQAMATLSANQRSAVTLHDIEGWSTEEICAGLDLTAANQRVLLHRARRRVRRVLEQYLGQ